MTFTRALATNNYGPSKFIVDGTTVANGTHSTIAAALTSASSGDTIFIRPGTYTENLTLKAGVNLAAYVGDSQTPNVTIVGNCTGTFAGSCSISNIRLQTNSAACLTVSGSSATIVNLFNCFINMTNNGAITLSSSSASSVINLWYCNADSGTTGIAFFTHSGAGTLRIFGGVYANSGATVTNCTASGTGGLFMDYVTFNYPITTSSTANLQGEYVKQFGANLNTTMLTQNSTAAGATWAKAIISSGTASCVSVGSGGSLILTTPALDTTNTNAITGAGTIVYSNATYYNTGKAVNTTTITPANFGSFTPTVVGASTAGTTTYTAQVGRYILDGNGGVTVWGTIIITGATGTGNAVFGGLPFATKNITNYNAVGTANLSSATWTWPASTTQLIFQVAANASSGNFTAQGSGAAGLLQMNNSSATFAYELKYII